MSLLDSFKVYFSVLHRYATVWVMAIWALAKLYWETQMTEVDHQAFYDLLPYGIGKFIPITLFIVSFFVAHGWPQPALEAKIEEKKAEITTS